MIDVVEDQVDLILNVDAITSPLTGIGRYAMHLALGLRGHPGVRDVRYFSAFRWVDDPQAALRANAGIARVRRHIPMKGLAMQAYFAMRQRMFARLSRRFRDYVLHTPNYLLFEHGGPRVTTVHDLSWLHYPEYHPAERVRIMRRLMPRSLAEADAVITDSEFVRREVMTMFSIDPARVHAIPLGVDASFVPRTRAETHATLSALGLQHDGYLLALATLEPRKNLDRLVEAYRQLDPHLRKRYPLVLAGAVGWHASGLVGRIDALVQRGEAFRLGFVSDEVLPHVVAGARALAFPSTYEGFGLPPLEAMASGIPVVASSASSIPEVTGDAALLVAPEDTDGLAAALRQALSDEEWRAIAIARGVQRAGLFQWQRCVDATVDVYRRVAARVANNLHRAGQR